jgi:hypothetical protein
MKERVLQAASEREFAKFGQAVQELNDRIDEARFQQILNRLLGINHRPRRRVESNPSGPVTVIPLRCVDCYLKAELVQGDFGCRELRPAEAPNCRHQSVQSCPSLRAAFARARASLRPCAESEWSG